ncbi:MAG: hypothetical protein EBQ63_05975 [Actinobacteria bacterium]|nr:hypothetical protein [Actinomycetota bacterium]
MKDADNQWWSKAVARENAISRLRHFPGASSSCCVLVENVLAIVSDKKMSGLTPWHPIINYPFAETNSLDFAGYSANLKALYLLHDG